MTRWDRILVLAVLAAALLSAPVAFAARGSTGDAVVVSGPAGISEFPLSREGAYEIQGSRGRLTLVVRGGDASISEADCPDRVCVDMGLLSRSGVIVCAPNGVTVRRSDGGDGLDALSR